MNMFLKFKHLHSFLLVVCISILLLLFLCIKNGILYGVVHVLSEMFPAHINGFCFVLLEAFVEHNSYRTNRF